jgi:exopolysaccharide biosynthesis polyprenyl glycosylphosphotransferase
VRGGAMQAGRPLSMVAGRPRAGVRPARLLVLVVVPAVDALVLLLALVVADRLDDSGAVAALTTFTLLAYDRTMRTRLNPRLGDDLPSLLARMAVAFILATLLVSATGTGQALEVLTRVAPAAVPLVLLGRAAAYASVRLVRARRGVVEPTLIVGAGQVGTMVAATLAEHPEYGLAPVGFLDSTEGEGLAMPVLGDVEALVPIIERNRVTRVLVTFGWMREAELISMLRACDALPVEVYVVPRFFELGVAPAGRLADDVWGIPLVWLRRPALRPATSRVKRLVDLLLASIVLVLAAPLLAGCALAVRLSSPGPVLLRQKRLGQDGRPFEMLKFRTLLANTDADTTWSVAGDARVTRVGRTLRATGLDELPQVFNVLRGEMSVVGPRPERPHFVGRFAAEVPRYDHRHRVPCGITGWAQVHGLRGDTPIPDRVRFDNHYIEHWSLWFDLVILARTISHLMRVRHR